MLKKLDENLDRGVYWENYHTRGLTLYYTEPDPEEGSKLKVETFADTGKLKARLAEIQPDLRQWLLNPIRGSDAH